MVCFPRVSAKNPAHLPSLIHASCISCLFLLDFITRTILGMAGVQIELLLFIKFLSVLHTLFSVSAVFIFLPILLHYYHKCKKVKWSRYRPGVAQRVGRGIALLFHYRITRRRWVVRSTPRPHFTPGTHFTGGCVGPRAGLAGRKTSSPPGFDSGPSSP